MPDESVVYFKRSATQNHAGSAYILGLMYLHGYGDGNIPQNALDAEKYARIANRAGHELGFDLHTKAAEMVADMLIECDESDKIKNKKVSKKKSKKKPKQLSGPVTPPGGVIHEERTDEQTALDELRADCAAVGPPAAVKPILCLFCATEEHNVMRCPRCGFGGICAECTDAFIMSYGVRACGCMVDMIKLDQNCMNIVCL